MENNLRTALRNSHIKRFPRNNQVPRAPNRLVIAMHNTATLTRHVESLGFGFWVSDFGVAALYL